MKFKICAVHTKNKNFKNNNDKNIIDFPNMLFYNDFRLCKKIVYFLENILSTLNELNFIL